MTPALPPETLARLEALLQKARQTDHDHDRESEGESCEACNLAYDVLTHVPGLLDAAGEREEALAIIRLWSSEAFTIASALKYLIACDASLSVQITNARTLYAERDECKRKYHEAMNILTAYDKLDHAEAVGQLLSVTAERDALQAKLDYVAGEREDHIDAEAVWKEVSRAYDPTTPKGTCIGMRAGKSLATLIRELRAARAALRAKCDVLMEQGEAIARARDALQARVAALEEVLAEARIWIERELRSDDAGNAIQPSQRLLAKIDAALVAARVTP